VSATVLRSAVFIPFKIVPASTAFLRFLFHRETMVNNRVNMRTFD